MTVRLVEHDRTPGITFGIDRRTASDEDRRQAVSGVFERLSQIHQETEVRDHYGLPGASSVAKAVETLIGRGLLAREEEIAAFDRPFFLRWGQTEVVTDLG